MNLSHVPQERMDQLMVSEQVHNVLLVTEVLIATNMALHLLPVCAPLAIFV